MKTAMMLLQNNFYNIQDCAQTDNMIEARIAINATHEIFKGHFPDRPVVPGVCMVQISKELAEKCIQQHLRIAEISQIKYLKPIIPEANQYIQVHISLKDELNFNATWTLGQETAMKMNGKWHIIS